MEVMISVYGETSHVGKVFHCGDAYATVVSIDSQGQPVEIPFSMCPQTMEEHLRCAGAVARYDSSSITEILYPSSLINLSCYPRVCLLLEGSSASLLKRRQSSVETGAEMKQGDDRVIDHGCRLPHHTM